MTDNWQEKLVEELAKEACGWCQSGIPMYVRPCYEQDERWHESPGKLVQCYANRPGLREAIRRTLEYQERRTSGLIEAVQACLDSYDEAYPCQPADKEE